MIDHRIETLRENFVPAIYDAAGIVKYFPLRIENKSDNGRVNFRWDKNALLQLQRSLDRDANSTLIPLYSEALERAAEKSGRFRVTGSVSTTYVFVAFLPAPPLSAQATPFVPVANLPENNENIPALAMREVLSNIHRNTRRRYRRSQKRRRNTRRRR